ncbi:hypothetical protein QJQ45_005198 [Haematococcus lacustris]|nr:hypothetical protein QJQ45_005198 [Haematococcus lacustris]
MFFLFRKVTPVGHVTMVVRYASHANLRFQFVKAYLKVYMETWKSGLRPLAQSETIVVAEMLRATHLYHPPCASPRVYLKTCIPTVARGTELRRRIAVASVADAEMAGECSLSFVTVDNKCHPALTKLNVSAANYSGLLTTITWVLHGMNVRVQHGVIRTADDGFAEDTLWVTNTYGKKLSDATASMLRERLQEFVVYCEPQDTTPQEWVSDNVEVSNSAHPQWTQLIIRGEPPRHGFLLQSCDPQEAYNTQPGAAGAPPSMVPDGYDFSAGRFFKFLLTDKDGSKLDAGRVSALLFTLQAFTGQGHMPLTAPSQDAFARPQ